MNAFVERVGIKFFNMVKAIESLVSVQLGVRRLKNNGGACSDSRPKQWIFKICVEVTIIGKICFFPGKVLARRNDPHLEFLFFESVSVNYGWTATKIAFPQ